MNQHKIINNISVRYEELETGGYLLVVGLDREKALNALTLEMINRLLEVFEEIEKNPDILVVWLESTSEKSFCSGGDVVKLTDGGKVGGLSDLTYASDYLASEYTLDYLITLCQKPVIAWGNGFILGGGMGLFQGARVRVITEESTLAMPETRIGFIPDCGASQFLHKVPYGLGLAISMTGASISPTDALYLDLADWLVPKGEKYALIKAVKSFDWYNSTLALNALGAVLNHATSESKYMGPWELCGRRIANSIRHSEPRAGLNKLFQWIKDEPELADNIDEISPGAALLAGWQFRRTMHASFSTCLVSEHDIAMKVLVSGDWCEGVRALLVDKDRQPKWCHNAVDDVGDAWVLSLLKPSEYVGQHPVKQVMRKMGLLEFVEENL